MNHIFPNYCFWAKYLVHIPKIKVKNFCRHCYIVKLFLYFSFFTPLPSFQCLSCICWWMFISFSVVRIFLVILFLFIRTTLYNTWKSHHRQLQVPIMIFNKKAFANISSISNSKNPTSNLLSFVSRIYVNQCLKNRVRNCFSFVLISTYR